MKKLSIYRACCYINFGAAILFFMIIAYVLFFLRPFFETLDIVITVFTIIACVSYISNDILGLQMVISIQLGEGFSKTKRVILRFLFVILSILQVILFIGIYQIVKARINLNFTDYGTAIRTVSVILCIFLLFLSSWGLLICLFPLLSQTGSPVSEAERDIQEIGQPESR